MVFTTKRHAERGICYSNSIRPSITRMICIKTAECVIEILSISDRPIILVFRHQGSLRKSDGFTLIEGAENKGCSDFRPICGRISETVIDRAIFTMEDEYALSNSAAFDDLDWLQNPVSRSRCSYFKAEYLANGASDPLHVWICTRVFRVGGWNAAICGSIKSKMGSADLMVQLSITVSDLEPQFQGHSIVKGEYLANGAWYGQIYQLPYASTMGILSWR